MYLDDKKKLLRDFARAIAVPVSLTDADKWPIRAGRAIAPIRKFYSQEYFTQIKQTGVCSDRAVWKRLFSGSSQIWRLSHHLIGGLSDAAMSKNKIADNIQLHIDGALALSNDNYFCEQGPHLILCSNELNCINPAELIEEENYTRSLLPLSGILWAFSETNYFVAHELSCEYHGPYKISPDKYIIIRDFDNLRPYELWPNFDYAALPSKIRIITLHNMLLDVKFDVYNNLYDEKGTLKKSLVSGAVFVDGCIVRDLSYLRNLSEKLTCLIGDIYSYVSSLNQTEIIHKYIDLFWYRKKGIADYLGVSWKPSSKYHDMVEENLVHGSSSASNLSKDDHIKKFDYSMFVDE